MIVRHAAVSLDGARPLKAAVLAGLMSAVVTIGVVAAVAGLSVVTSMDAHAQPAQMSSPWPASSWVKGYSSTTRLVAGARGEAGARTLVAGVEIKLDDGWKTYWRHPGDAGGVPPSFDWSGSDNLGSAHVRFPAPDRLVDPNGASIGYKKRVVFPVEIQPVDPARPVLLKLQFEFGICREICVPAEVRLELAIPPDTRGVPPELTAALARVPRLPTERQASDPTLKSAVAVLSGPSPKLSLELATAAATELYVESVDGIYLPMPTKTGSTGGVQSFAIDLKGVEDIAKLAGKPLRLTAVTATGGAELTWVVK